MKEGLTKRSALLGKLVKLGLTQDDAGDLIAISNMLNAGISIAEQKSTIDAENAEIPVIASEHSHFSPARFGH